MTKRILHVIPSLDRAGAEKQMTLLVANLPRAEFDVHVCALTRGGPLWADLRKAEVPVTLIGKSPYVDGGVREVAPLKRAIDDGAQEIICVVCQPESLQGVSFLPGNLADFALRLMDIVTNELVNNDRVHIRAAKDDRSIPQLDISLNSLVDRRAIGRVGNVNRDTNMRVDTVGAGLSAAQSDLFLHRRHRVQRTRQ